MQTNYKEIGNRIRIARETAGLSRKDLADCIDTSASYAANIENGKKPSLEALIVISKKCNVSLDWLIHGVEFSSKNQDDTLNEILKIYNSTPIDARGILLGVIKTIMQNSNNVDKGESPKETTSSTLQQKDGSGESNIA